MIPGSGADSELAALLASRRRTSKTAVDDDGQNLTSGATCTELGQTTTTTSGTGVAVAPAASPGRPEASAVSSAAVESNLHVTRDVPVPVAEEGDAVFAEVRRKLRPVAGSLPSVSAAAAAAAAAAAVITPDQTPKRAAPRPDDIRGWNEGSSSCPPTSMHNNATSHDNADIVAGGLVDDNIEIKTTVLQPNPTQPSHSVLHEVAIGDNLAATSNHEGAGDNVRDISSASKREREGDRTAATHITSRRDSVSSGTSSARPKTPARVDKTSPTRDVSSSASRRLRASPRYQRYLAKNRSDAAATKHDAAAPVTTKSSDKISSSSSEEGEESSQASTFQNVAKADDRTLMSPPRDSLRPFSRLEGLGFDADHPAHTHSTQGNAGMCENNLPFSRQASPIVAENPIEDIPSRAGDDTDVFGGNTDSVQGGADVPLSRQASPIIAENPIEDSTSPAGDDTDVFGGNTDSVQGDADMPLSRQASPIIAENPIEDSTSPAGDYIGIFGGNELDDIIARACGNPSLHVSDTVHPSTQVGSVVTSTTEEGHNYPRLQDADGGGYLSDMVSISDATVKQGNTIDDEARVGDSTQTTPRRRTSKDSAFTPSPRRSPAPRVPRKGEVSPTARLVRLEVENGKLRNQVSRLTTEVGIKEAIIADLKQRLNDLKPNEGRRVEAKSLKRVLQKERDFVPLNVLHEPLDPKFLC